MRSDAAAASGRGFAQRGGEATVQHFVGFVQNEERQPVHHEGPLTNVVKRPTGCATTTWVTSRRCSVRAERPPYSSVWRSRRAAAKEPVPIRPGWRAPELGPDKCLNGSHTGSRRSTSGVTNASVLPDPVRAWPMTSRPSRSRVWRRPEWASAEESVVPAARVGLRVSVRVGQTR